MYIKHTPILVCCLQMFTLYYGDHCIVHIHFMFNHTEQHLSYTTLRTCLGYVRNDIGRYRITNTDTQEVNQHKKDSPLFNIKNFLHLVGIKIDCKSSF